MLVLGDMAELARKRRNYHPGWAGCARVGDRRLFALGDLSVAMRGIRARWPAFLADEDLLTAVELELDADTSVLVKGSRSMQMERVVQSFEVARP